MLLTCWALKLWFVYNIHCYCAPPHAISSAHSEPGCCWQCKCNIVINMIALMKFFKFVHLFAWYLILLLPSTSIALSTSWVFHFPTWRKNPYSLFFIFLKAVHCCGGNVRNALKTYTTHILLVTDFRFLIFFYFAVLSVLPYLLVGRFIDMLCIAFIEGFIQSRCIPIRPTVLDENGEDEAHKTIRIIYGSSHPICPIRFN